MARILVVEDNEELAFGLGATLEAEGHEVVVAKTGEEGLARARDAHPHMIVLDVNLPRTDGFTVLKLLREERNTIPVLLLTARGSETDIVRGFSLGADDYVTKPFSLSVLQARVKALLRRGGDGADRPDLAFGRITIDPASRTVFRDDVQVQLTYKEYDLLLALLGRRGSVASRPHLLREVWGHAADVQTRTVDIHIAELRRKLEDDPSDPKHILTVWKVGYRLVR